MSLCLAHQGSDYSVVASDCIVASGNRTAELGGRVQCLRQGWLTYTCLEEGAAKLAASVVGMQTTGADPVQVAARVRWAYENLVPDLRPRHREPDTEGTGLEGGFFVAAETPEGARAYVVPSDGDLKVLKAHTAFLSPPPGVEDVNDLCRELMARVGASDGPWDAFRRAGAAFDRIRDETPFVSRHVHVLAVARPGSGDHVRKLVYFGRSDRLSELSEQEVADTVVDFEGCQPAEKLREKAEARAAAVAGG